ncbi:MAG: hypothetical protein RR255_00330 [Bacilli bacterium]
MKEFKNLLELNLIADHAQKLAIDYVTDKMVEEIKYIIPHMGIGIGLLNKVYNPTGEFAEAWTNEMALRTADYVNGVMRYDGNLISTVDETNFIHGSYYSGVDVKEALPYIIFGGKSGKLFGDGFWTEPRNAWSEMIKNTDKNFNKWIKEGFKLSGLDLK